MNDYRERKTVFEVPIKRARPVVEAQYDSVVHERRGVSGASVVALVLAAVAATVAITLLIMNIRQRDNDQALAQQQPVQQPQQPIQQPAQQPPAVVSPPVTQPAAPAAPSQPVAVERGPSSAEIEAAVMSKLLDDPELASIEARVVDGTVTLSGRVPDDELKARAEEIARGIRGVRRVINRIVVQSQ
jgi:ribosomal protein L13E